MEHEDIIGKAIARVTQMKKPKLDDMGWLRLDFSDGTHCVIQAHYSGYTGKSEDEYPTGIDIFDDIDGLVCLDGKPLPALAPAPSRDCTCCRPDPVEQPVWTCERCGATGRTGIMFMESREDAIERIRRDHLANGCGKSGAPATDRQITRLARCIGIPRGRTSITTYRNMSRLAPLIRKVLKTFDVGGGMTQKDADEYLTEFQKLLTETIGETDGRFVWTRNPASEDEA